MISTITTKKPWHFCWHPKTKKFNSRPFPKHSCNPQRKEGEKTGKQWRWWTARRPLCCGPWLRRSFITFLGWCICNAWQAGMRWRMGLVIAREWKKDYLVRQFNGINDYISNLIPSNSFLPITASPPYHHHHHHRRRSHPRYDHCCRLTTTISPPPPPP